MEISALFPSQHFVLVMLYCPLVFLLIVGLLQAYSFHLGRLLAHTTAASFPILGSILHHRGPLCGEWTNQLAHPTPTQDTTMPAKAEVGHSKKRIHCNILGNLLIY